MRPSLRTGFHSFCLVLQNDRCQDRGTSRLLPGSLRNTIECLDKCIFRFSIKVSRLCKFLGFSRDKIIEKKAGTKKGECQFEKREEKGQKTGSTGWGGKRSICWDEGSLSRGWGRDHIPTRAKDSKFLCKSFPPLILGHFSRWLLCVGSPPFPRRRNTWKTGTGSYSGLPPLSRRAQRNDTRNQRAAWNRTSPANDDKRVSCCFLLGRFAFASTPEAREVDGKKRSHGSQFFLPSLCAWQQVTCDSCLLLWVLEHSREHSGDKPIRPSGFSNAMLADLPATQRIRREAPSVDSKDKGSDCQNSNQRGLRILHHCSHLGSRGSVTGGKAAKSRASLSPCFGNKDGLFLSDVLGPGIMPSLWWFQTSSGWYLLYYSRTFCHSAG